MSPVLHLVPAIVACLIWYLFFRFNRRRGWFRIGELIFWDVIILILAYLVWLIWF